MSARSRARRPVAALLLVAGLLALAGVVSPVGAVTTRIEAESLTAPAGCWSRTDYSPLSGGAGRSCSAEGISLTWNVTVSSGQTATVKLYGYQDSVARSWRARIDGGAWTSGTLSGAAMPSVLFYTSPTLSAGTHTVNLEWVSSAGGFTADYAEVTTSDSTTTTSSTTTTVAPTTTTTAPSGSTIKIEAESLTPPAGCWSRTDYVAFSGGAGRSCTATNIPLTWNVTVNAGQAATVKLYGYQDSVARSWRARTDGGAWASGTLSGATVASALFYTSPSLSAGAHTVDLEWVNSAGGFTADYAELTTAGTSGTTTTTAAPATTTTTTAPPAGTTCNINPANSAAGISNAIAACSNGTAAAPTVVKFPLNASYTVTDSVFVDNRSNLTIDLNGSTITNTY
ncbi:MAG: hypothetical protein LC749_12720, partial [Actinobacteria bacterium]|nr:hypothetical protein [Actinomycetota bacterium]